MTKLDDSKLKELIKKQNLISNFFSGLILVIYFSFILVIAFNPSLFSKKVYDMELTVGILSGLLIIVFSMVLTFIYVIISNTVLDNLRNSIIKNEK